MGIIGDPEKSRRDGDKSLLRVGSRVKVRRGSGDSTTILQTVDELVPRACLTSRQDFKHIRYYKIITSDWTAPRKKGKLKKQKHDELCKKSVFQITRACISL